MSTSRQSKREVLRWHPPGTTPLDAYPPKVTEDPIHARADEQHIGAAPARVSEWINPPYPSVGNSLEALTIGLAQTNMILERIAAALELAAARDPMAIMEAVLAGTELPDSASAPIPGGPPGS